MLHRFCSQSRQAHQPFYKFPMPEQVPGSLDFPYYEAAKPVPFGQDQDASLALVANETQHQAFHH